MSFNLQQRIRAPQVLAASSQPWFGEYQAAKAQYWNVGGGGDDAANDFKNTVNAIAAKYGIATDPNNLLGILAGGDIAESESQRPPWYKDDSGISPAQAVAIGVTLGTGAALAGGASLGGAAEAGGETAAGTAAETSGAAGAFDAGGSAGVFDSFGNPLYVSPADAAGGISAVDALKAGSGLFSTLTQYRIGKANAEAQNRATALKPGQANVSPVYSAPWKNPGALTDTLSGVASSGSNWILFAVVGILIAVLFMKKG